MALPNTADDHGKQGSAAILPVIPVDAGDHRVVEIHGLDSLGDPFRTGVDQDKITWTYGYYRYRVFGETCTKDLIIYYNPDGTVSSYTFNTSFPDEKNSWRDRRTP